MRVLSIAASPHGAGGGSLLGPSMPTMRRPQLGPWPEPQDYVKVLPFTPPTGRTLDFYRGQFCGLRVHGAPVVPGSNGANPDCIMSCLLDNYPEDIQNEFLDWYASYGYTHLQRSLGHALGYGHSIESFIALTKKAREQFGLLSDVWFIANELPAFRPDADASYWGPVLDPYIKQLLDAGCIDLACVGWQMDQWNVPGNPIISIIADVAARLPKEIPLYTHWMNEALAWWRDGGEVWSDPYQTINIHDRFSWWYAMRYYLSGGHHQGNTRMLCKEYQDRICDTLDYFGDEHGRDTGKGDMGQSLRTGTAKPFALTVFECSGQDQFDDQPENPYAISEDEGDQRGYLLMCTTSQWGHLRGYGNGARRPDGLPL
jgi:hypothetical protein